MAPAVVPTPEPSDDATDEPTDDATDEPTDDATDQPTGEPSGEPTDDATDEPTTTEPSTTEPSDDDALPVTGARPLVGLGLAVLLAAAGVVALAVRRRTA